MKTRTMTFATIGLAALLSAGASPALAADSATVDAADQGAARIVDGLLGSTDDVLGTVGGTAGEVVADGGELVTDTVDGVTGAITDPAGAVAPVTGVASGAVAPTGSGTEASAPAGGVSKTPEAGSAVVEPATAAAEDASAAGTGAWQQQAREQAPAQLPTLADPQVEQAAAPVAQAEESIFATTVQHEIAPGVPLALVVLLVAGAGVIGVAVLGADRFRLLRRARS